MKTLTKSQHLQMISFGKEVGRNCSKVCDSSYSWLAAMVSMKVARKQILKTGAIIK